MTRFATDIDAVTQRINDIWPHLNERERRLTAASEARALGYGGISAVSSISGLSRATITKGIKELSQKPLDIGRIRKNGAGRPSITSTSPNLIADLTSLVESATKGDPITKKRWISVSTRKLAGQLNKMGYSISYRTVAHLLNTQGYSLQSNRKDV